MRGDSKGCAELLLGYVCLSFSEFKSSLINAVIDRLHSSWLPVVDRHEALTVGCEFPTGVFQMRKADELTAVVSPM